MLLISNELKKRFTDVGNQHNVNDPIFIARFHNQNEKVIWFATEFYPSRNMCYGYVIGLGVDEWCFFSIEELESLGIKADTSFKEIISSRILNT